MESMGPSGVRGGVRGALGRLAGVALGSRTELRALPIFLALLPLAVGCAPEHDFVGDCIRGCESQLAQGSAPDREVCERRCSCIALELEKSADPSLRGMLTGGSAGLTAERRQEMERIAGECRDA